MLVHTPFDKPFEPRPMARRMRVFVPPTPAPASCPSPDPVTAVSGFLQIINKQTADVETVRRNRRSPTERKRNSAICARLGLFVDGMALVSGFHSWLYVVKSRFADLNEASDEDVPVLFERFEEVYIRHEHATEYKIQMVTHLQELLQYIPGR